MMAHMKRQLGPAWFQELSETQTNAANEIFDAISDEADHVMYKRCRSVLSAIGIDPLPKRSEMLKAIQFSRNNDLAFLWFLYSSVYNTCDDISTKKDFSLNERLLLSCICHLDMMTTLRELDRIMPKPEAKAKQLKAKTPRHRKIIEYESPYLEPVPKPKVQPERFYPPLRRSQPNFKIYRNYKDPMFIIRNETNRWFADQNLLASESRNIAKGIVCDQISKVVEENFDREKVFASLCETHRRESTRFNQIMSKLLKGQLNCDEENLKDLDPFERGVIYGIQLELAKTENEFRNDDEKYEQQVMTKTLIRKIVENAADLKFIRLCEKCQKCVQSKELYQKIVKRNSSLIEACSEVNDKEDDKNQIEFFKRSSSTTPFEFNYEKIFATNFLNDCGVVKNSINAALELDKHLSEDNAITVCLQDMWRLQFKLWNEKRRAELEEKSERVVADCNEIGKSKQKVFQLLTKGIDLMRKNPKFVLAALPEVDRLPILRQWMLQRFSFRFDDKENEERWKLNKLQRDRVEVSGLVPAVKVPTSDAFGIKKTNITMDVALLKKKQV